MLATRPLSSYASLVNCSIPQVEARPSIACLCAGDAREMGIAQGKALSAKIAATRRVLRDLDAFRLEQPKWLPYPVFLKLAETKSSRALEPALRRLDPGMLARLEGIAEGSGASLPSLCLLNSLEALLASVQGRTEPLPLGGCSALAVRGNRSATGEAIIARNFDYIPLVQPYYIMRESRPRNGYRSLEFSVAPLAGAIDGVNEHGLCITLNYAFATDSGAPAPLISMSIADALAHCTTVTEAVERISNRSRWGAGMLMIADASGDLASLELTSTRSGVRRPMPSEDCLLFTNVCSCPETREVQVPENHLYSERVPQPLRGKPVLEWHASRARRLDELVRKRGKIGPEDLAVIMADHGPTGVPDGSSPCVHTNYWRTTGCLQWFPAQRSVRVSFTTACAADYVELRL
jgi:hypothetical protein